MLQKLSWRVFNYSVTLCRSLEFEQASFGERAAALVNAKVIKCEPFSCSIALSNGDQISGNIAVSDPRNRHRRQHAYF